MDDRPLLVMPANEFIQLGREDLISVIAYLKQVPAVDRQMAEQDIGPLARFLHLTNEKFPLLIAAKIDHSTPLLEVPPSGVKYGVRPVRCGCVSGVPRR